MRRVDITYRITKIGKHAVSVAVCGLGIISGIAQATTYNLNDSSNISPSFPTNSIDVTYNASGGGDTYGANPITITLNPGINLTGESPRGSIVGAIFTRDTKDGGNTDSVSFITANTTLNLVGNNNINGNVGWHWSSDPADADGIKDPIDKVNINGTNVTFNSRVYANVIDINQGGTVSFYGNIDGETPTTINLKGNNASITLHDGVTLNGSITNTAVNGTLIFTGSGTITGNVGAAIAAGVPNAVGVIEVRGNNSTVRVDGNLFADRLDYQAKATVSIGGNLDLKSDPGVNASNSVKFNNSDGTLLLGGNLTGIAGKAVVTTSDDGKGTVTMLSGVQTITGHIGSSSAAIKTLNIGGTGLIAVYDANANASSSTTADGDIYAKTISLNNNNTGVSSSSLTMASGRSITGNVVTDGNSLGNLTLAGGTQTVTGTVGANGAELNTVTSGADGANSTFTGTGAIFAATVANSGNGTSNYQGDVTATNIDVLKGTSNFSKNVTATTTTISTGTGSFNTDGTSTTNSAIVFTGNGTANLWTGLTGTVAFTGNNATVNLWNTKSISGAISTTANNTGIVNARGGGTLTETVGANGLSIKELNVNTQNEQNNNPLIAQKNIFATTVQLQNDGELQLKDSVNLTGNVTTSTDGKGTLTLLGNTNPATTNTVTGNVGTVGASLRAINAGSTGEVDTFTNGVVYAKTLSYKNNDGSIGNGEIQFLGSSPANVSHVGGLFKTGASDFGFVGKVDFGSGGTGKFSLGNNVDLDTQTTFMNANLATLRFLGNSVVTGDLGSGTLTNGAVTAIGTDTFKSIEAGVTGSTVSFRGDVFVSSSTFHVMGTGIVNFLGNLNGPLVFEDDGARAAGTDGSVNVADGKSINGAVSTVVAHEGILNFVGSTSTKADIGSAALPLYQVNFHNSSTDTTVLPVITSTASIGIGHNIYADTTTIGNGTANPGGATVATITTSGIYLGQNLVLTDTTTLNTAGSITSTATSPVDFLTATTADRRLNADGTITPVATVTRSTFGTGVFTTNGATLNFALGTSAWAANAGGVINPLASSSITGATGSTLVMNGNETVNVMLLGSMRNGQTHTLVDVAGGVAAGTGNTAVPGTLNDNSFVIDTALSRANGESGDLVITATRLDDQYITKSLTTGHFSNAAALRLGTLGAAGVTYTEDMQTVLNKLDLDQWGYGNNAANLAVQVKRLAPVANNSYALTAFRSASLVGDSIGARMHQLRIPDQSKPYEAKGLWVRTVNNNDRQGAQGDYDGFKSTTSGAVLGLDTYPSRDSIVGVAVGYSNSRLKQQDFRLGDEATVKGAHLTLYGAYNFTPEFYLGGQVIRSWVSTDANRSTAVGRVAKAGFDSGQVSAKVDLGYRIQMPNSAVYLTPVASFETSRLDQQGYTESNAGAIGLNMASEKYNRSQTAFGLRIDGTTTAGGMVVKPEMAFMATRDSGGYAKPVVASYIGDLTNQASFSTDANTNSNKNGYRLNLGLGILLNKSTAMAVRYDYSRNAKPSGATQDTYTSNALDLAIRWNF